MACVRFRATIEIRVLNPYVLVSQRRAQTLKSGWRKPMPVLVQINGEPRRPWRINMMPKGDGSFYLYLHGSVRKASLTTVGDRVSVSVRFDAAYRGGPMHPMPSWFRTPLFKDKNARKAWGTLAPSRQKEILRYLSSLKSEEARARNVVRSLHFLSGKRGRFTARAWRDGAW
jgi:hypothetical protein